MRQSALHAALADPTGEEAAYQLKKLLDERAAANDNVVSMKIRNMATENGRALGHHLARFCDEAEPQARLRYPELPPRCASCAFREGPHVQNGSVATTMDATKCWLEGVQFNCHEPGRKQQVCSGWAMMMLAKDAPDFIEAPWPFSNETGELSK